MIVLRPPDPLAGGARPAPLSVAGIVRRAFDCAADPAPQPAGGPDPELSRFLTDLLAPYGQAPYPNPVEQTYAGMVEVLLDRSGPPATQVDLVVIAHAVPDADPRRSAAHVLHHLCPGGPLAFALSDQGVAAPFSAVATAAGYLRTDGFERAVVLILEQAALPYPAVQPVSLPQAGSAVALVLERSDAMPVLSLDQRPAVEPERVGAVLAELTEAAPPESVVVLGPGLAGHVEQARRDGTPLARARLAPAGRLCTAVWWELADAWEPARGTVVADYDPALGGLCVLTLGPRLSGRPAATTW
jgi:hypothetical protein